MKKLLEKHPPQEMYPEGDDAAGFRKQLIQSYHCISCDRPVELLPQGQVVLSHFLSNVYLLFLHVITNLKKHLFYMPSHYNVKTLLSTF